MFSSITNFVKKINHASTKKIRIAKVMPSSTNKLDENLYSLWITREDEQRIVITFDEKTARDIVKTWSGRLNEESLKMAANEEEARGYTPC